MECKTPTLPTHHAQAPPWHHPNMECKALPLPTSRNANTVRRTPPPRHNANTSHRTLPPCHPQHSVQNGAAVGTVGWGQQGWRQWGWQRWRGTPTYLRLYIFYLCNKLILFLYFVIKANNILLLLSITDVKSNNNK